MAISNSCPLQLIHSASTQQIRFLTFLVQKMYNGAGHISLRDAGVDIGYLELLGASLSWRDLLSPPHRSCDCWCPTGAANGHQPARNNDLKTQVGGTTSLCVMLGGGEPITFPMEPSEGDSRTEDKHNHRVPRRSKRLHSLQAPLYSLQELQSTKPHCGRHHPALRGTRFISLGTPGTQTERCNTREEVLVLVISLV